MKRVIRIGLMALLALAVMVPAHAAAKMTVGDFLTQIAQATNLPAKDGATAAASLKSAGVNLPALDLKAPLTEGAVAKVANAMGLRVTTSNPQAPFTKGQLDSFVSAFGAEIGRPIAGKSTEAQSWWWDWLKKWWEWWKRHHHNHSRCDP
jgi:hypothetical protein